MPDFVSRQTRVVRSVFRPSSDRLLNPSSKVVLPVAEDPIVSFANRRQQGTIWQLELVEWVATSDVGVPVLVLDVVNPYSNETIPAIPALNDFVLNPRAASRTPFQ